MVSPGSREITWSTKLPSKVNCLRPIDRLTEKLTDRVSELFVLQHTTKTHSSYALFANTP